MTEPPLLLFQTAVTGIEDRSVVGILVAAVSALFGVLMLEMRGRRERAEKGLDAAIEDNRKHTLSLTEMTATIREQRSVVETAIHEIRDCTDSVDAIHDHLGTGYRRGRAR